MTRLHLAAGLLLVTLLAAAAAQRMPENTEPTDLRDSECFRCHETGGGAFGPPLVAMYTLIPPDNATLEAGGTADYEVILGNTWTAELSDIQGVLDLEEAPSLGFATDIDPIDQRLSGSVEGTIGSDRVASFVVPVPAGVSDLRIAAIPAEQPIGLQADLALDIIPSSRGPDGEPIRIDDTGAGATEVYRARGIDTVASLGTGNWTVRIVQPPLRDLLAGLVPQTADLHVQAWFNTTGERQQPVNPGDILNGQSDSSSQESRLKWRLLAESAPSPNERLTVTVDATAYYDHPGTTSGGIDAWRYTQSLDLNVFAEGGIDPTDPSGTPDPGDGTVIDDGGFQRPELDAEEPLPWDRIGEIIGYVSAFLLLLSMYSGGIFGRASRRQMNKIFKSAKRRVAFHNFVSYLLTFFAIAHTVLFIVEPGYPWTLGLIWGTGGLLAMIALGFTGALQVPMIRRWNYGLWRGWHLGLAIAALVLTIVHMLLDGANFTEIAEAVGWSDPFQ